VVEDGEDLAGAYSFVNAVISPSSDRGADEPVLEQLTAHRPHEESQAEGEQQKCAERSSEHVEKEDANEIERERATTRELYSKTKQEPPSACKF
jgi:hypothetical protein